MANNQKELKASSVVRKISKDKLKRYIQKYLNSGYAPSYLKKFLLDQGYDKDLIEKSYTELGLKLEPELQEKFREIEKKLVASGLESYKNYFSKIPRWGYAVLAAVLVLAFVAMLYPADETDDGSQADDLSRTFTIKDCGNDKSCFLAEAKRCNDAVYEQELEGSVIGFSSAKKSDEENSCMIRKKFKSFSVNEPKEIKDLFQDLEMECTYKKESFDQNVVNDLVAGIEKCDGLLKDAIYELRIAQIELELGK